MTVCENKTREATKIYDFMNYHIVFWWYYLNKLTLYNTITSTFEMIKETFEMWYQLLDINICIHTIMF
jgi:hypothetical protein